MPAALLSTFTGGLAGAAGASAGLARGVGTAASLGTFGTSAAGNAYQQAVLEGADPKDAKAYAALVGVSETSLQYLLGGIGKLGGLAARKIGGAVGAKASTVLNGINNSLLRNGLKSGLSIGGKMTAEGLEEGLQEFIEPVWAALSLDTDYEVDLEAAVDAFIIGGMTAGLMEGGSSVANVVAEDRIQQLENYLGESKVDYFAGAGDLSSLTKKLKGLQKDTEHTADVDRQYAMRKAYYTGQEVAERIADGEDGTDVMTEIIHQYVPEVDRETIYNAFFDAKLENSTPEQIEAQRTKIEENYFKNAGKSGTDFNTAQAIYEATGLRTKSASQAYRAWALGENEAKGAKKNAKKAEKAAKDATAPATPAENAETQTFVELDDSEVKARTVTSAVVKDADGETAVVHDVNDVELVESGEAKRAVRVASVENGKVTVELEDGERVSSDAVSFYDLDTATLYKRAGQMSANAANLMIEGYDRSGGGNVIEYADAFDRAYTYGRYGISQNELKGSALKSDRLKAAYEAGRKDGLSKVTAKPSAKRDGKEENA